MFNTKYYLYIIFNKNFHYDFGILILIVNKKIFSSIFNNINNINEVKLNLSQFKLFFII